MAGARSTRYSVPANKLSDEEREQIIAVANSQEFAHLPPSQIVPRLVDRGEYVAHVLRGTGQLFERIITPAVRMDVEPGLL